ncbi:hypothetical protein [Sphingomonas faeni]|uniref:hypothetical protein n=1 Tax=Sphingomonas faeni TaxID=185950 RepID=UPI0033628233
MSPLQTVKLWTVRHMGLAKDALHIYVALGLFLGSATLFKWRLSDRRPWLIVLLAALAGEAWDLRDSLVYGTRIDVWANWHDIWNTLFWPSLIVLLARLKALRV